MSARANAAKKPDPAEILAYLAQTGHAVALRPGGGLDVQPALSEKLAAHLRPHTEAVIAHLRATCPPADAHAFVTFHANSVSVVQELALCLACGIRWRDHGERARPAGDT